jgi:hypothetical protein
LKKMNLQTCKEKLPKRFSLEEFCLKKQIFIRIAVLPPAPG